MKKEPFRRRKVSSLRYYSWSEIGPHFLEYLKRKRGEEEPDRVITENASSTFGEIYGKIMHAYIEKVTDSLYDDDTPGPECLLEKRQELSIGWQRFWQRHFVRGKHTVEGKFIRAYFKKGLERGIHDLGKYLDMVVKLIPIPKENTEVSFQRVRVRTTGFHLTVKIDQLRPEKYAKLPRMCIVDLKFDDCSDEEFRSRAREHYFIQLQVYALVYLDLPMARRVRMELPQVGEQVVVALWHVPKGQILHTSFTPQELEKVRLDLKKFESKYKHIKAAEWRASNLEAPAEATATLFD